MEIMMGEPISNMDYERVARAIGYLRDRATQQPQLEEVADHVGLSPFHFQRLFTSWAGVSPKRFLQYLTVEHAKVLLAADTTVLETTYATGLSSPSRLHDLFVATEAVTPGEYKSGGAGLQIGYGFADTPFGRCLVGTTTRGVVALAFGNDEMAAVAALRADWFGATLAADDAVAAEVVTRAFAPHAGDRAPLRLLLRGTNFQIQVWRALLEIPFGDRASYGAVARRVGNETGARAVGNAVGANPIGYLIPCHRVIRADGHPGGYRWGSARKTTILGWERAQIAAADAPSPH
jgi:AraC family transcriptional regulator of adaptative response/methylated-DNA-[protein]-cysteine methyltransferase